MSPLTKTLLLVVVAVVLVLGYFALDMYRRTQLSERIVNEAVPFSKEGDRNRVTILVVGDSTAVGVGAEAPKDSVAGRLAEHIGATYVENYARSGASASDMAAQFKKATLEHYDVVLVQVGANNIIRRDKAEEVSRMIRPVLKELKQRGDHVIHLSAGNVGAAPFFPFFIRPYYHSLTQHYHTAFEQLADELGTTYVNLYVPPEKDPFVESPGVYLAADGLHPSSEGYRLWFDMVRGELSTGR